MGWASYGNFGEAASRARANGRRRRRDFGASAATAAALVAAVAAGTACKGEGGDGPPLPGSRRRAEATTGDITLTGAGATFPYPLYSKWVSDFGRAKPGVRVNYQSIGSGGGIRQFTERTVDFGATDAPMNDEQLAKVPGALHVPTCAGAVVLAYNLEGVPTSLKLTRDAAAGIYLGTVTRWNDPAIARENPGVALPDRRIATVHRSDGSGTTKVFVDWLSSVSAEWKRRVGAGTSVAWPNKSAIGAKGNEGVTANVKSTPGAIGYIEYAYATQSGLAMASVQNRAGAFVAPSIEATTAAAEARAADMPADLRMSIVDAEGASSYPIASFTYVLAHTKQTSARKGRALAAFLRFALTEGQASAPGLHYAPLPEAVAERALAQLARLTDDAGTPLSAP